MAEASTTDVMCATPVSASRRGRGRGNTDLAPEFTTAIAALCAERAKAYADLAEANSRGVTGDDADAMFATMEDITKRAEKLRRRYFPRRHQLLVTHIGAMLVSKTGRSRELVWYVPLVKDSE